MICAINFAFCFLTSDNRSLNSLRVICTSWGGDKRRGNNSDAIAKKSKMKVSIVTVVIKVIEYVVICNNNDNMLSKFDI